MEQTQAFTTVTITGIKEAAEGVKLFYLSPDNGAAIAYKAGQYLTFVLPQTKPEIRRSYSLASSPVLNEPLCIAVKRIENGLFSRKLVDHAQVGDQLTTLGAGGVFVFPDDIDRQKEVFFFAAGSGIVPVFSLIKTALYAHPQLHLVLIYSNSSVAHTLFYEELLQLQQQFPKQLQVEFLFSNSKNLVRARLHAELIEHFLKSCSTGNYQEALYYICGPDAYMRLCTFTLRRLYVPAAQIKKEIFHTKKTIRRLEPPDKAPHTVTLLHGNREYTVPVQYPTTILQAARRQGVLLPYSCEAGQCGNCMAACISGKVWMAHNEVLTEREIEQGFVLTCTGYPVEGDAVLRV